MSKVQETDYWVPPRVAVTFTTCPLRPCAADFLPCPFVLFVAGLVAAEASTPVTDADVLSGFRLEPIDFSAYGA